jgi:hypothetical protein
MAMEAATERPAVAPGGKANCGSCGRAWFGDVAYCPYCGRRSASAPAEKAADPPPAADRHAAARADIRGPALQGAPQARDEPAPAPQASVPPALKQETGSAASVSAADERATQSLGDRVRSSAAKLRLFRAPAGAQAHPPGSRWKTWWKPTVAVAIAGALAVVAIAVEELAVTTSDSAASQAVRRAPAVGAAGDGTSGANAAPPRAARSPAPEPAPAPAPATAAVTTPPAPDRGAPAGIAQVPPAVPRADPGPQPRAPAPPPAPRRSLCSAANEAAGLCNPR